MNQPQINLPAWVALYSDDTALAKGYIYRQGSTDFPDIIKRKLVDAFPMVVIPNNTDIFRIMPIDTYYAFAITQSFEPHNVRREHYRTLIILINKSTESLPETLSNYFQWLKTEIKNFGPKLENLPKNNITNPSHKSIIIDNKDSKIMNWILNQIYLGDLNISHNFIFDSSEIKPDDWPYELSKLWTSLPKELRLKLNCAWFNEAHEFRFNDIDSEYIYIIYVPTPQLNPNWKRILNNYSNRVIKFNNLEKITNFPQEKIDTISYFFTLLKLEKRNTLENSIIKIYNEIKIPLNQFNSFFWFLENIQSIVKNDEKTFKIFYQLSIKLDNWVKNNYIDNEYRQNITITLEEILNQKTNLSLPDSEFTFILPEPIKSFLLKQKIANFWANSILKGNAFPLSKLHRANTFSLEILKDSIKIIEQSKQNINLLNSLLITLNDYSENVDNRKLWLNITQNLGIKLFNSTVDENIPHESIDYFKKIHIWLLHEISSISSEWTFLILALFAFLPLDIKNFSDILKIFPSDNKDTTTFIKKLWKIYRNELGASIFAQVFLKSSRLDLLFFIKDDPNLINAILDEPPSDTLIKIHINQKDYDSKLEYPPKNWESICEWIVLHSSLDIKDKNYFFKSLESFNLHFGLSQSEIRESLIAYAPKVYLQRTLNYFLTTANFNQLDCIENNLIDYLISNKPSTTLSNNFEYWIVKCLEIKKFNKRQISQIRTNILPAASNNLNYKFTELMSSKFPQFISYILNSIEEILNLSSKNNKRPQLTVSDQIIIEKHGNLADKLYLAGNDNVLLKKISSTYQERCDLLTFLLSEIITKRGDIDHWWKRAGQKAKHFPDKETTSEIWSSINEYISDGTISYNNALKASWDVLQRTRDTYIADQRRTYYAQLARLDLYHHLID